MTRKAHDPLLIKLLDEELHAREEFERWYRRAKRAFTGMEKARRKLIRIERRVEQRNQKGEK
jgi:hypothetical protein